MPNSADKKLQSPSGKIPGNIFVCLGGNHHLEALRSGESVAWTINRRAQPGDAAVFYLINPISAFVGIGTVEDVPWYDHESEWREKYFSVISGISVFDAEEFVANAELQRLFPEWRYLRQPRSSVATPSELVKPLWELIQSKIYE